MSVLKIRDEKGNIIEVPALKSVLGEKTAEGGEKFNDYSKPQYQLLETKPSDWDISSKAYFKQNESGAFVSVTGSPEFTTDTYYQLISGNVDLFNPTDDVPQSLSHIEGSANVAGNKFAHVECEGNYAGKHAHAEGRYTKALGTYSHTEGQWNITGSNIETDTSNGNSAHAEGVRNVANGIGAHAEGGHNRAYGKYSHTEGYNNETEASAESGHAEGMETKAKGIAAHSEGRQAEAIGEYSHSEGYNNKANGRWSHAEGASSQTNGTAAHAEGVGTNAVGYASHSQGQNTIAEANASSASGMGTHALGVAQSVVGKYNKTDKNALFIVGNGTNDEHRSNAFEVHVDGHAEVQTMGETENSVVKKSYVDGSISNTKKYIDIQISTGGGEIPVDQAYNATSANAQSGNAVAQAIDSIKKDAEETYVTKKGLEVAKMTALEHGYNIDLLQQNGRFLIIGATGTLPAGYSEDNSIFIECYIWEDCGRQILHDVRTNETFSRNLYAGSWRAWEFEDRIVESGTSGIWTYEKWASGKAKCWGITTHIIQEWVQWGNLYEISGAVGNVEYPFEFIEAPLEIKQVISSSVMVMLASDAASSNSTTTSSRWDFIRATDPNKAPYTITVGIDVKGRWK